MIKFLHKYSFLILILVVVLALFVANYTLGTYLMGWDNLQTDLNPWLGVRRALWSGWQEYQSFGLPAGMAHSSDLVRALWVWILSSILPAELIRYFVHFSLVGVGAVGAYTLIKSLVKSAHSNSAAFVGSLFYLLNFYTVQMLALPFEAFTFFFALLPWELWIFIRFITEKDKKWKLLLLFIVINICATPQAYAQQIFAVYMLTLGVTSLSFLFTSKEKLALIKKSVLAVLLILAINSFWILPQIYFLKTSASVVTQSKMNQMATDHVWNQNKAYGNVMDFALMNNFFSELKGKDGTIIFGAWNQHRNNPLVLVLGIITALMVIAGTILSIVRKQYIVVGLLLLSMTALLINTVPFDTLNIVLRKIPILHQIFRSPFTKYGFVYALTASIALAFCIDTVIGALRRPIWQLLASLFAVFVIAFPSLPAWNGQYLSPSVRVHLPPAYTDLFTYFRTQDLNARIGLLPEYTYWGWYHHRWGYDGSGFMWYGIEQPIVSRTFDVWSKQSENYYWELQSALISEDDARLTNVLEKYRIDYLVYDSTLKPIVGMDELIIHDRTKMLLASNPNVKLEKTFGNMILVYKVLHKTKTDSFVRLLPPLVNIVQNTDATSQDIGYTNSGDYQADQSVPIDNFVPFANLNSQSRADTNWKLARFGDSFRLNASLPLGFSPSQYALHQTCPTEECAQAMLDAELKENKLQITYPAVLSYEATLGKGDIQPCDSSNKVGTVSPQDNKAIYITTANPQSTCIGFALPTLLQDRGYVLEIISDHTSGRNLTFYMTDLTKKQTVLDDILNSSTEYYVIPPRSTTGIGYSMVFQDSPFHGAKHENILKSVRMYELPFESIARLQIQSLQPRQLNKTTDSKIRSVQKNSYYSYTVQVDIQDSSLLVLDQAYEEGWIGMQIESTKLVISNYQLRIPKVVLLPHVRVNGWANAWLLEEQPKPANQSLREPQRGYAKANGKMGRGWTDRTILLLFWPQYLEYGGVALGVLTLLLCFISLLYRKTNTSQF